MIALFISSVVEVALRKESVDRNGKYPVHKLSNKVVALRKESVDRNLHALQIAA